MFTKNLFTFRIRQNFYYLSPHGIYVELEDSLGQVVWKRDPQFPGFSGGGYAVVKAVVSILSYKSNGELFLKFTSHFPFMEIRQANLK